MAAFGNQADMLRCSVCLNDFTDPRALPCLHTFCLNCLVQLTNFAIGKVMKCPICKEAHQIPTNGAQGFRKDFRINNLLDLNVKNEQSVKIVLCKKHPKLELSYLCRQEGCNRALLCAECTKENHVNHKFHPIKQVRNSKLTTLSSHRKAIGQNLQVLRNVRNKLERNKQEMKDKVTKQMAAIRTSLAKIEENVTGDIDRKTTEQVALISKEENSLKLMHSQLEGLEKELSDTIPSILTANADQHLDTNFNRLQNSLEEWKIKYGVPVVEERIQNSICTDVKLQEEVTKGATVIPISPEASSSLNCTVIPAPVKVRQIASWEHRMNSINCLTCHAIGREGITIVSCEHSVKNMCCTLTGENYRVPVSTSHIDMYKQLTGFIFSADSHGYAINGITSFRKRCHAVIDEERNEVRLHTDYPVYIGNPHHVIDVEGQSGGAISGTDNYVVFTSKVNSSVRLWCYSVAKLFPERAWSVTIKSIQQVKSVNATERQDHLIVIVAGSYPQDTGTAVIATDGKKALWVLRFQDLDRTADSFDLSNISNDGRYFYVVNNKARCIYLISAEGKFLTKVLENLPSPVHLSINAQEKQMVVAYNGKLVKVYKLMYTT